MLLSNPVRHRPFFYPVRHMFLLESIYNPFLSFLILCCRRFLLCSFPFRFFGLHLFFMLLRLLLLCQGIFHPLFSSGNSRCCVSFVLQEKALDLRRAKSMARNDGSKVVCQRRDPSFFCLLLGRHLFC